MSTCSPKMKALLIHAVSRVIKAARTFGFHLLRRCTFQYSKDIWGKRRTRPSSLVETRRSALPFLPDFLLSHSGGQRRMSTGCCSHSGAFRDLRLCRSLLTTTSSATKRCEQQRPRVPHKWLFSFMGFSFSGSILWVPSRPMIPAVCGASESHDLQEETRRSRSCGSF